MLINKEEVESWDIPEGEIEYEMRLAEGISTLESGFQIAWVKTEACPILCLLCDRNGNAFARLDRDKTVRLSTGGLSRAELEAIEGMKRLVLGWD